MLDSVPPSQLPVESLPAASGASVVRRSFFWGLSGRVLLLAFLFVMLAELAIFVPSIANFRRNWIKDRLSSAYIAALVLQATPTPMVPKALSDDLLQSVGATVISIKIHGMHRMLAVSDMPPAIDDNYDARISHFWSDILGTWRAYFAPAHAMLNITGPAPMGGESIAIVVDETALQRAMRVYSVSVLLQSLLVSTIVGALAVWAMHLAILRPVRRLTSNLMRFGANPENPANIIVPSSARHEIADAEHALRIMEQTLVDELRNKKNLAALGLAVAKINHDLRNMLSAAQLLTDRLVDVRDPLTQRLAPKLVSTLDRGIRFCQAILAYGKAQDEAPRSRNLKLHSLILEVFETLTPRISNGPTTLALHCVNEVPVDFVIRADPEHMFRVFNNLCRNSVDALASEAAHITGEPTIRVRAHREAAGTVIEVADNGPGVPPRAKANLFAAFQGSTRSGGTGLGLAIAADLVRGHGGTIMLVDGVPGAAGAVFRILLPEGAAHS
ncbi:MAG: HAMP domain-containing histidine kinase [Hyphomicrobiales bacterium]|nr:HAMP domain-containing histidine kinase [Hyphomicrobiales bacterium]MDE2115361.1 HAMP domain-containing histidine kinase [Hyphomicrobiales bacterium]